MESSLEEMNLRAAENTLSTKDLILFISALALLFSVHFASALNERNERLASSESMRNQRSSQVALPRLVDESGLPSDENLKVFQELSQLEQ